MFHALGQSSGAGPAFGFRGLEGFGSPDARPNVNYVMAGDIMRIKLVAISSSLFLDVGPFKSALAADGHLRVVSFDDSGVSTWQLFTQNTVSTTLDVQALNDFSQLNDVLTYTAGVAQNAGVSVDLPHSNISFVSKVEQTKGGVPQVIDKPDPNAGAGTATKNADGSPKLDFGTEFQKAIASLTASPTTLLAIVGLGVIGLIVLTKK